MRIQISVERIGQVVHVWRWPGGSRVEDYVNSCNLVGVKPSDHWTDREVVAAFGERLGRRNGREKGRVLYLYQWRLGRGHVLTAGLAYHIDPAGGGRLQVMYVAVAESMPEADVVPAVDRLLNCTQHIALLGPLNQGRLQWICRSDDEVRAVERYYAFRIVGRLQHGDTLMEREPVH